MALLMAFRLGVLIDFILILVDFTLVWPTGSDLQ